MKKLLSVCVILLALVLNSNSQIFSYGIKIGLNRSSLSMEDIKGVQDEGTAAVYDLLKGESVRGFQAGLMTRIKIAMVYVQPELYYNVTGGSVEQVLANGTSELLNVQFNRIDIPLLVGVKFGPARINAGPVGSTVLSSSNELPFDDLETLSSGLTWGYQAGVGLDIFNKLTFDVRYEGSLSQYGDSFTAGTKSYDFDARPTAWIFALGWWF